MEGERREVFEGKVSRVLTIYIFIFSRNGGGYTHFMSNS